MCRCVPGSNLVPRVFSAFNMAAGLRTRRHIESREDPGYEVVPGSSPTRHLESGVDPGNEVALSIYSGIISRLWGINMRICLSLFPRALR